MIASSFAQELKDLANRDACLISTGGAPGGDSNGGCPDGIDGDQASALDLELSQFELWRDDPSDWPSPLYNDSVPCTVAGIHLSSLDCTNTDASQWTARDDVKGGILPAHLVKSARAREI